MALTFSEPMRVGTPAPQFELQGFSGVKYSLSQLIASKKGILVVFTCNHCPYATASWYVLMSLSEKYPDIQFVAINPNESSSYPEDSPEGMQKKAMALGLTFPYLVDDDQSTAKAYKAVCTPDPFLFKVEEVLRQPDLPHQIRSAQDDTLDLGSLSRVSLFYHGRINDNWQHEVEVTEHNLEEAIKDLLEGRLAPEVQPPSMGCSIKWKS